MDKLAKALNKARAERSMRQNNATAQAYQARNTRAAGTYTPVITPGTRVAVSEEALDRHRVVAHRNRSKDADTFRILRTQILKLMTQGGMKTLGITSPNYGDGKTTVALNLALSIALDMKQTVLLVDLDLRKPNVVEYLGIHAPIGLTDYFTHDEPIANCLIRTTFERFSILPAGPILENSSEVLGSPKIAALAEEMRTRYSDRLIIYDMPPILAQDDPLVFLPHVDGVLMVVGEGRTRTHELRTAMQALGGAHVLGTVLNNSTSQRWQNARVQKAADAAAALSGPSATGQL